MARYEISNEVRPLDRLITGFASSCGYEIQTVFNDLLRFIIHGFSPGAPPMVVCNVEWETDILLPVDKWNILRLLLRLLLIIGD